MRLVSLVCATAVVAMVPAAWGQAPPPSPPTVTLATGSLQRFSLDGGHTAMTFAVRYMGLSKVRGRFRDATGTILFDPAEPPNSSVTIVIDAESIDTDNNFRDRDLKKNWFEVEEYPHIVFQSSHIERSAEGYLVHGRLTIKDVTRDVTVPMARIGPGVVADAWNNVRMGFEGTVTLDRMDYGVDDEKSSNPLFDASKFIVGDRVDIGLEIQAMVFNRGRLDAWGSRDPPPVGKALAPVILDAGAEAAVARYHELRTEQPDAYDFSEGRLYDLGERLRQEGHLDAARAIFELQAAEHPESDVGHALAGEAAAQAGDFRTARRHLERALDLNPARTLAIEWLRRLPDGR